MDAPVTSYTPRAAVPPWALTVVAMLSVQLGSALSVDLIATVGAAGTAWLRLTIGALIFLALARPPLRDVRRRDVPLLLGLGATIGLMTIAFLVALEHVPLGVAVSIEFLGPLTVAAARGRGTRAFIWPSMAMVGVVLLAEPWTGNLNLFGVMFAATGAVLWGTYIVLTQRVGDRFTGIGALSLTIPIAAAVTAVIGIPQAAGHLNLEVIVTAAVLAVLLPVLPFTLELLALRRMTHSAFGTLMALEPAFGVLLGLIVLHQHAAPLQIVGITLVVIAGAAAQRGGQRDTMPPAARGPVVNLGASTERVG